jgi:hypothetical protein
VAERLVEWRSRQVTVATLKRLAARVDTGRVDAGESERPAVTPSPARSRTGGAGRGAPTAILACLIAGVALSACGGQANATGHRPPTKLLRAALADANARGSVHVSESAIVQGRRINFADDLARYSGRQEITLSTGERAHVLIVGTSAYTSGNQAALVKYFAFPASVAGEIGRRWVRIPASSSA